MAQAMITRQSAADSIQYKIMFVESAAKLPAIATPNAIAIVTTQPILYPVVAVGLAQRPQDIARHYNVYVHTCGYSDCILGSDDAYATSGTPVGSYTSYVDYVECLQTTGSGISYTTAWYFMEAYIGVYSGNGQHIWQRIKRYLTYDGYENVPMESSKQAYGVVDRQRYGYYLSYTGTASRISCIFTSAPIIIQGQKKLVAMISVDANNTSNGVKVGIESEEKTGFQDATIWDTMEAAQRITTTGDFTVECDISGKNGRYRVGVVATVAKVLVTRLYLI